MPINAPCTSLVQHERRDFLTRELYFATPEAFPVRQSRMGTHLDAMSLSRAHRTPHHARVGRVKAASHVRVRDERHHVLVVAQVIDPECFTHVAIDRQLFHRLPFQQLDSRASGIPRRVFRAAIRSPLLSIRSFQNPSGLRLMRYDIS
jgi:hypothetical protein